MGRGSKERRRLAKMLKRHPNGQFSGLADLATGLTTPAQDRALWIKSAEAIKEPIKETVVAAESRFGSFQKSVKEKLGAKSAPTLKNNVADFLQGHSSKMRSAGGMTNSRLQKFVKTVFNEKTILGSAARKPKGPFLGLIIVLFAGIGGYYGFKNYLSRSGSMSSPVYQYRVEHSTPYAESSSTGSSKSSGSSFLGSSKLAEVLKLGTAKSPGKSKYTVGKKSGKAKIAKGKKSKAHGKHLAGYKKKGGHHVAMKKGKHGKGYVQKASHKKKKSSGKSRRLKHKTQG